MTDESRNSWALVGMFGFGLYLLWKNRPEPADDPLSGEQAEDVHRTLMGSISGSEVLSDDLARLKRKLDRHAAEFDPAELERGTEHEMEHTRNRLVAQKIAMDHLRENPGYYKILEEIMPESA